LFAVLYGILDPELSRIFCQWGSSANTQTIRPPFQTWSVKLDFPRFGGADVLEWIFKAEQFFDYYKILDADQITITSVHMEKDVVPWFQMIQRSSPFHTWAQLTLALETKFGPSPFDCPKKALFKFQQTTTVSEFYLQLMALANRSQGLLAKSLLACFLDGLSSVIQREVIAHDPKTLLRAVALAKMFEEKFVSSPKPTVGGPNPRNPNTTPWPKPSYTMRPAFFTTASSSSPGQTLNLLRSLLPIPPIKPNLIRPMTTAEMQLRREWGQCFTYDERFSATHCFPNRQMMILHLEDDEVELDKNAQLSDSPPPDPGLGKSTVLHLSLHAM